MSLPSALTRVVPNSSWQLVGEDRWVEIVGVAEGVRLGFTSTGTWALAFQRGLDHLELQALSSDAGVASLPLLEHTQSELVDAIRSRAALLHIDPDALVAAFPWTAVVRAALRKKSDYWVRLSLDWMEGGVADPNSLAADIDPLLTDRRLEQQTRQRLLRMSTRQH